MKKDEERERERILDSPEQLVCVDITRLMHPTAYCAAIPRKVSICKEKHSAWQLQTSGCGSIILYRNNRVGKKRWPGAQATAFLIAVKHTPTHPHNREKQSLWQKELRQRPWIFFLFVQCGQHSRRALRSGRRAVWRQLLRPLNRPTSDTSSEKHLKRPTAPLLNNKRRRWERKPTAGHYVFAAAVPSSKEVVLCSAYLLL